MPLPAPSNKLEHRDHSAGSRSQQSNSIALVTFHPKQDAPPPVTPVVVSSDAALVLRNLRLLDLDRLPDWPGVTIETFKSTKDVHVGQKDRIRAAESVLYRLFEIWDPKETKNALRPFFPSLEPLQSIKLRGALLQWLISLKTNGVLGRECMIRKSMLDDCKGEKFEEVLLHFSTAVLKKMLRSHETKTNPASIAEKLGSGRDWHEPNDSRVNALLYAYESSLRSKRGDQVKRTGMLRVLETDLMRRMQALQCEKEAMARDGTEHDQRLKEAGLNTLDLKKNLRHDCNGDSKWLNITISGDTEHGRDAMIEDTFDKVWNNGLVTDQPTPYDPIPASLLADLEDRVKQQQERLTSWRAFQTQLSKRNEQFIVLQSPAKTPFKSPQKPRIATAQSTPRRAPSLRKRLRGNHASLRLQEMQSSPMKLPHSKLEDDHKELEQARDRMQPLGSPPDLLGKSPVHLRDREEKTQLEEEQFCEDMAALDVTAPSQSSPIASPPPLRPSRLPSPSKSPSRKPQVPEATIQPAKHTVFVPARPDRTVKLAGDALSEPASSALPTKKPAASLLEREVPAGVDALSGERETSTLPTPPTSSHETLSQRTQRTMADWQQKMSQASEANAGPSPKLHRHTKSVPDHRLKSTPDSSPERVAKLSQRNTPHKTSAAPESASIYAALGSGQGDTRESDIAKHTVSESKAVPSLDNMAASSGRPSTSPTPRLNAVKPATPPQAVEMVDVNMDDMSVFKPRNRLRRSPPNSPSPWA